MDDDDDLQGEDSWFCSEAQALPVVVESLDVFAGHLTSKVIPRPLPSGLGRMAFSQGVHETKLVCAQRMKRSIWVISVWAFVLRSPIPLVRLCPALAFLMPFPSLPVNPLLFRSPVSPNNRKR